MKEMRFRIANGVDVSKPFSATIRGGVRGYTDALAIDSHSNDVCPTIKTVMGFTVIVEPYEDSKSGRS